MSCERCGSRMLSKVGSRSLLVCSDCGTPHRDHTPDAPPRHLLSSSILLVAMGTFSLLLFLITNWGELGAEQARERGMIKKLTTGEYVQQTELPESNRHSEGETPLLDP